MNDASAETRLFGALSGRYTLERELGEGGMATVYLAHDVRHDRRVALKVLRAELAAVVGAERFLAEIRTTANLQHPHILPLFDSGEAASFLFYVMPYVEGESMRARLERERQLPVEEALRVTEKVASALQYAHEQGVIHRDIKPENILLSRGEPLVADFGIALAVSQAGGGRITETGLSLGTPHYMSPEQASGERTLDVRSDVYSLGCVLYEMLTGEPPHSGATAQSVLAKILTEEPRRLSEVRHTVPPHVDAAVAKALEKLPADRFDSAAAFSDALEDEAFVYQGRSAGLAALRAAEGRRGPPLRWLSDRRSVVVSGIALIASVAALLGWLSRWSEPAPGPVRLSLDLGRVVFNEGEDVVVSPDGSLFAVAGIVDGQRALYVRRADEVSFRAVSGTENASWPAFSPDGNWIVYRDGSRDALMKVSVDGGTPLTVLPAGLVGNPQFMDWGDDGTIVFRASESLFRVRDTGGEPERLPVDANWSWFPRLLPGGRGILLSNFRGGSIGVFDLESDSLRPLISEGMDAMYVETGHILYAHPNGGLFAVAFDPETLEVTGQPVPLLDDVWLFANRAHYSVSRNGTLVYGRGVVTGLTTGQQRLLVVHLAGRVDTLALAPRIFGTPRWSPDGSAIAYFSGVQAGFHIFTYNVELGTSPRQLTSAGDNRYAVWSADGTRIAFSSVRGGTDGADLFVRSVNGDAPEERILSFAADQDMRHWPADDLLVFERVEGGLSDLWMLRPSTGGEPRVYLEAEADLDDIVVSPDGQWAAYQSDETGVEEVYVRSFPEPRQQILVSMGGGQFPRWSPDGSMLYYWAAENAPIDSLIAARVQREPTFSVLSRRSVLAGNYVPESWDLHPAGDRIVVAQPVSVAQPSGTEATQPGEETFLVVVNWFEELKARMAEGTGRGR